MAKYIHKLLKEALLDMMEAEPLDDISVVKLIRQTGINRKTFYNHYRGMTDLLCRILTDECVAAMGWNVRMDNWSAGVERMMYAMCRQERFVRRIRESRYAAPARMHVRSLFDAGVECIVQSARSSYERQQGRPVSLTERQQKYLAHSCASVLFSTLEEWFEGGRQEPIPECVQLMEVLTNSSVWEGIRFFDSRNRGVPIPALPG